MVFLHPVFADVPVEVNKSEKCRLTAEMYKRTAIARDAGLSLLKMLENFEKAFGFEMFPVEEYPERNNALIVVYKFTDMKPQEFYDGVLKLCYEKHGLTAI